MKYALALAATAAVLGLAAPAAAATYSFTLNGDYSASWELDSSPMVSSSLSFRFRLNNVTGDFPELAGSSVVIDFYTWNADPTQQEFGGFTISDQTNGNVLQDGYNPAVDVQLFTGPTSAPTFKLGTFNLLSNVSDPLGLPFQLTIAEVGPAVPEPATWAMMIAGFGLVGGAMRRATRTRVSYAV